MCVLYTYLQRYTKSDDEWCWSAWARAECLKECQNTVRHRIWILINLHWLNVLGSIWILWLLSVHWQSITQARFFFFGSWLLIDNWKISFLYAASVWWLLQVPISMVSVHKSGSVWFCPQNGQPWTATGLGLTQILWGPNWTT